ncbi:MAG: SMI1/KNR4 family protein [Campylobacter sp.]|nr:SMI1/KNR4 family protein [Campylobacter sp.]
MIYELDEIEALLDEIYAPLEKESISGMRLLRAQSCVDFKFIEKALDVVFSEDFKRIVSAYEFDNLEINNISFGTRNDYAKELIRLNSVDEFGGKWWQGQSRPKGIIVVALSDPYTYAVRCASGEIYAMLGGERAKMVCESFAKFIQIMATIDINRRKFQSCDVQEIIKFSGSNEREFWQEIIDMSYHK